jgi:hypothetical protein
VFSEESVDRQLGDPPGYVEVIGHLGGVDSTTAGVAFGDERPELARWHQAAGDLAVDRSLFAVDHGEPSRGCIGPLDRSPPLVVDQLVGQYGPPIRTRQRWIDDDDAHPVAPGVEAAAHQGGDGVEGQNQIVVALGGEPRVEPFLGHVPTLLTG